MIQNLIVYIFGPDVSLLLGAVAFIVSSWTIIDRVDSGRFWWKK